MQHLDAQNSKTERKKERKHIVYNYLEHVQHCETF